MFVCTVWDRLLPKTLPLGCAGYAGHQVWIPKGVTFGMLSGIQRSQKSVFGMVKGIYGHLWDTDCAADRQPLGHTIHFGTAGHSLPDPLPCYQPAPAASTYTLCDATELCALAVLIRCGLNRLLVLPLHGAAAKALKRRTLRCKTDRLLRASAHCCLRWLFASALHTCGGVEIMPMRTS